MQACCACSQGSTPSLPLPCRAAEKQALASHRKPFFPERPVASELFSNSWQISKKDRKQVLSEVSELEMAFVGGTGCPQGARVSAEDAPHGRPDCPTRLKGAPISEV